MLQIACARLILFAGVVLFVQALRFKLGKSRWLEKLHWMLLFPSNRQAKLESMCFLLLINALLLMVGSLFLLIIIAHR